MRKAWYAAGVFLGPILIALITSAHGVLLTPMIAHYALEESAQGLMSSAQSLGCVIAFVSAMWAMGRAPKAKLLLYSMIAAALTLIPIGFAPPFWALVTLFLLFGIAMGYMDTLGSSIIADLFEGKAKTRMLCVLHGAFGLGGIFAPMGIRALLSVSRWNWVFLAIAGFAILCCGYLAPVNLRQARLDAKITPSQRLTRAQARAFFANGKRALALLTTVLYVVYLNTMNVWLVRYVEVGLGAAEYASLAFSLFFAGMTACRLLSSAFAFPAAPYLTATGLLGGAALLTGVLIGTPAAVCAASLISSLLSGAAVPMLLNYMCESFPENTLLATTSVFFSLYLTQVVFSPLTGAISGAFGLNWGMIVAAASLMASGGVAWRLWRGGGERHARVRGL